ncbi:restriction endonuclease subunit S [Vibrio sp. ZSDZ65]|uniref:Restriction endonuclease subunit S n=1 Tax=Vibrio qingdaonensis TaxID=2829491 RepID=A0A9X3CQJ7_9VIBR|nr:restriction endonuclease subunit S [Vibrio qingdaonensis]MCW8347605.1 restriction endonuclease subunit S [Vibrio qingdaonensis]
MNLDKKVPDIRFIGFSEAWKSFSLDEISDVLDGDRGHNYPNGEDLKEQGHTLFLSASNVTKNGFKFDVRQYITQEKSESLGNGKLIVDDIILTSRGSIGHIAWYNEDITKEIPFARINSGMLILRVKNSLAPSVISQYLKSPKGKKKIEVISFGSAQPQLTKASISKFSVSIPSDRSEQAIIGNYFQKLDNLIKQHHHKHDKLSSLKNAMLVKMFPKKGETVPEIRFKRFTGEWEEKSFGACFVNVGNNTLSRAELNYQVGLAKNIHYGDVLIKFGETLDADSELIPFITNNGVANKLKHTALKNGDIVIADAAEDNTVGKCVELFNVGELLVFSGLHTIAVRPTLPFASKYLGYYLNSASYHDQLSSLMQGTKVLSISKTTIQNTHVVFPNHVEEQAAIGNYFQKLDSLINQHQQQITKLTNIKQACLSKMFV